MAHTEETSATVPCNWCGEEIEVRVWEADSRHYCSRECSKAWNVYLRKGSTHPNYKHGETRGKIFRWTAYVVRHRDGECLRCGRERAGDDGRALHVHHITPEEEADDPHDPKNLLSVCAGCHRHLEGLSADEQLQECGIDSRDELVLEGGLSEWLEGVMGDMPLENAPDPRPGMFEEAQRIKSERDAA